MSAGRESVQVSRPHVERTPILNEQGQVVKARLSFVESVAPVPLVDVEVDRDVGSSVNEADEAMSTEHRLL